ncbi:hypothetical protein, partial [Candidatus Ichthyocystis sparus]|uniref:hypothetical protein n=1 Tax=Candidatus Ichthyocystis sparus TaxID=1561004 RepID=UPI00159EDF6D
AVEVSPVALAQTEELVVVTSPSLSAEKYEMTERAATPASMGSRVGGGDPSNLPSPVSESSSLMAGCFSPIRSPDSAVSSPSLSPVTVEVAPVLVVEAEELVVVASPSLSAEGYATPERVATPASMGSGVGGDPSSLPSPVSESSILMEGCFLPIRFPDSVSSPSFSSSASPAPTSSSSPLSTLSLSSTLSGSGFSADLSSRAVSPVLSMEVGLATEGTVSAEGVVSASEVLVGEASSPVPLPEQLVVTTVPPSVSVFAEVEGPSTSAGGGYFAAPKKSYMSRHVSELSSSPTSGSAVAGPSSSASGGVVSGGVTATGGTTADEEGGDVGERLAAILNRGLPPTPPP